MLSIQLIGKFTLPRPVGSTRTSSRELSEISFGRGEPDKVRLKCVHALIIVSKEINGATRILQVSNGNRLITITNVTRKFLRITLKDRF